jgi:hypothetical protein
VLKCYDRLDWKISVGCEHSACLYFVLLFCCSLLTMFCCSIYISSVLVLHTGVPRCVTFAHTSPQESRVWSLSAQTVDADYIVRAPGIHLVPNSYLGACDPEGSIT